MPIDRDSVESLRKEMKVVREKLGKFSDFVALEDFFEKPISPIISLTAELLSKTEKSLDMEILERLLKSGQDPSAVLQAAVLYGVSLFSQRIALELRGMARFSSPDTKDILGNTYSLDLEEVPKLTNSAAMAYSMLLAGCCVHTFHFQIIKDALISKRSGAPTPTDEEFQEKFTQILPSLKHKALHLLEALVEMPSSGITREDLNGIT